MVFYQKSREQTQQIVSGNLLPLSLQQIPVLSIRLTMKIYILLILFSVSLLECSRINHTEASKIAKQFLVGKIPNAELLIYTVKWKNNA